MQHKALDWGGGEPGRVRRVGHAGRPHHRPDQGGWTRGEAAGGQVETATAPPGSGRDGKLRTHARNQRLARLASAQRGGHPPDVGPDAVEVGRVFDTDHPDALRLETPGQGGIAAPLAHHHLGPGGQYRFQVGPQPRQALGRAAQIGVRSQGAVGKSGDLGPRREGQDELVGALIERRDAGAGGGRARQHQGRRPDDPRRSLAASHRPSLELE